MGNTATAGRHSPAAHFRREARVQIQTIVNVTQNSLVVLRRLTDKLSRKAMAEKDEAAWLAYEKEHGVAPTTAQYEYVWNFMPDGSDGSKFWYEKVHAPNAGRWAHPVHEIIDYGATEKRMVRVDGMRLEHHADPAKSRGQYLHLLELSVDEDPTDDRNMHYLGREYMFYHRWDDSIMTLLRHLMLRGPSGATLYPHCTPLCGVKWCSVVLGRK